VRDYQVWIGKTDNLEVDFVVRDKNGFTKYIPAPYTDKNEVIRVLREAVENGASVETEQQHVERVTDMIGKHMFD
jgi:hypothetical protein